MPESFAPPPGFDFADTNDPTSPEPEKKTFAPPPGFDFAEPEKPRAPKYAFEATVEGAMPTDEPVGEAMPPPPAPLATSPGIIEGRKAHAAATSLSAKALDQLFENPDPAAESTLDPKTQALLKQLRAKKALQDQIAPVTTEPLMAVSRGLVEQRDKRAELAKLQQEQEAENASRPGLLGTAIKSLPGAFGIASTQSAPLEVPAVPGKPLVARDEDLVRRFHEAGALAAPEREGIQTEGVTSIPTNLEKNVRGVGEIIGRRNEAYQQTITEPVASAAGHAVAGVLTTLGVPKDAATTIGRAAASPVEFITALGSPTNASLLLGLPIVAAAAPVAVPYVSAAITSYFGAEGAVGAAQGLTDLTKNWDALSPEERGVAISGILASAYMAFVPGLHEKGAKVHEANKHLYDQWRMRQQFEGRPPGEEPLDVETAAKPFAPPDGFEFAPEPVGIAANQRPDLADELPPGVDATGLGPAPPPRPVEAQGPTIPIGLNAERGAEGPLQFPPVPLAEFPMLKPELALELGPEPQGGPAGPREQWRYKGRVLETAQRIAGGEEVTPEALRQQYAMSRKNAEELLWDAKKKAMEIPSVRQEPTPAEAAPPNAAARPEARRPEEPQATTPPVQSTEAVAPPTVAEPRGRYDERVTRAMREAGWAEGEIEPRLEAEEQLFRQIDVHREEQAKAKADPNYHAVPFKVVATLPAEAGTTLVKEANDKFAKNQHLLSAPDKSGVREAELKTDHGLPYRLIVAEDPGGGRAIAVLNGSGRVHLVVADYDRSRYNGRLDPFTPTNRVQARMSERGVKRGPDEAYTPAGGQMVQDHLPRKAEVPVLEAMRGAENELAGTGDIRYLPGDSRAGEGLSAADVAKGLEDLRTATYHTSEGDAVLAAARKAKETHHGEWQETGGVLREGQPEAAGAYGRGPRSDVEGALVRAPVGPGGLPRVQGTPLAAAERGHPREIEGSARVEAPRDRKTLDLFGAEALPSSGRPGAAHPELAPAVRESVLLRAAVAARRGIEELRGRLDRRQSLKSDLRARTVGTRIADDLQEKGVVSLVGLKVRQGEGFIEDLATVGQVARDSRFETLRYLAIRDGEIVGEWAITSNLPTQVMAADVPLAEHHAEVVDWLRAHRAEGYAITHNHPTGDPTPSPADHRMTLVAYEAFRKAAPDLTFEGHVIINHKTYGILRLSEAGRDSDTLAARVEMLPLRVKQPVVLRALETDNRIGLGMRVADHHDLAKVAERLGSDPETITLVHASRDVDPQLSIVGRVRAVETIPVDLVLSASDRGAQYEKICDYIVQSMSDHGTHNVFLVHNGTEGKYDAYIRDLANFLRTEGAIRDAKINGRGIPEGLTVKSPDAGLRYGEKPAVMHVAEPEGGYGVGEKRDEDMWRGRPRELNGAPEHLKTLLDRRVWENKLAKEAKAAETRRFWYEKTSKHVLKIMQGDVEDAGILCRFMAITSPQESVPINWRRALQAFHQWKNGEPIHSSKQDRQDEAMQAAADAGANWEGRKTNNFYKNLMVEIDPHRIQGSTVDVHVMDKFGYKTGAPTERQYDFAEKTLERIAKKLGNDWRPHQVQAALWTHEKWTKNTKKWEAGGKVGPKPTIEEAGADFADLAPRESGRVTLEAVPPRSYLERTTPENKAQYTDEALQHVPLLDWARKLGLLPEKVEINAGAYEGESNPAPHVYLSMPAGPGGAPVEIEPSARALVERFAAMVGKALGQASVGYGCYFRLARDKQSGRILEPDKANAVYFPFEKKPTPEEAVAFLHEFEAAGLDGFVVPDEHGIGAITWAGQDREVLKSFRQRAVAAAERATGKMDVPFDERAHDGGLVEGGADGYESRLTGIPPELRADLDRSSDAVREVQARWEDRLAEAERASGAGPEAEAGPAALAAEPRAGYGEVGPEETPPEDVRDVGEWERERAAERAARPVETRPPAETPAPAREPIAPPEAAAAPREPEFGPAARRRIVAAPPVRMEGGVGPATKGEEMAQPPLGKRITAMVEGDPLKPKAKLNRLAELKDILGGYGLNQLEMASARAAELARRAASSLPKAIKMVSVAVPKIAEALKGTVKDAENFFTALAESRLRGIRDKYTDMIGYVDKLSPEELIEQAKTGLFDTAITAIDGKRGFEERDLPDELSTALYDAEGKSATRGTEAERKAQIAESVQGLRRFLKEVFSTARDNVGEAVLANDEKFEAYIARPEVKKALEIYKRLLEAPMRDAHELNEGFVSKHLGPMDAYFPLSQAPEMAPRDYRGERSPWIKPKNPGNNFATGLSDQYDTGVEALRNSLARSIRLNGRGGLIGELQTQGLLKPLAPGQSSTGTVKWGGQTFEAETVPIGIAMMISKDGKLIRVPQARAEVPKWLAKELSTILTGDPKVEEAQFQKILHFITAFQMGGPTDAVFHTANLVGTMVLRAPIVGTDIFSKAASANAMTKFVAGLANIMAVKPEAAEWSERYMEMVENGQIPNRAGTVTYSKRLAETTGAEKVSFLQTPWHRDRAGKGHARSPIDFSPIVFGPNGLDIRCRLLLDKIGEHIAEKSGIEMTPNERFQFTRMLGNYVFETEGRIERGAKSTGMAPFYTAGRQMNWNGIAGMLSAGHLPVGEGLAKQTFNRYRAMQVMSGLTGLVATWAVVNKLYRDKWPWEDDESRLFQIAIKPEHRQTALARAIYGDNLDRTAWVNLGFTSPLIARGLRVTGLRSQIENRMMKGMPGWKADEQSMLDTLNGWTHPFLGPPARMAAAFFGTEPYVQSLTSAGRSTPTLKSIVRGRVEKGWPGRSKIAEAMLVQSNPIFRRLETGKVEEHPATRVLADTMIPNLFGGPYSSQDTPLETILRENVPPTEAKTTEQLKQADITHGLTSRLRAAIKSSDTERAVTIREEIGAAVKEGKLPPHELKDIQKAATQVKNLGNFQRARMAAAVEAFEYATPAERKELYPAFVKKFRGTKWREEYKPDVVDDLTKRAMALIKQGPTKSAYAP